MARYKNWLIPILLLTIILLTSCSSKPTTNVLREIDPVLEKRVYDVLEEMDITDELFFKVDYELDDELIGEDERGIVFSTEYKDVEAKVYVTYSDGEWQTVYIGDFEIPRNTEEAEEMEKILDEDIPFQYNTKFYWVQDGLDYFYDLYDWETGRLVHEAEWQPD